MGPKMRPGVIFECVGVPGIIQQMLEGAPKAARIVVVGVCMEKDAIEPALEAILDAIEGVAGQPGDEYIRREVVVLVEGRQQPREGQLKVGAWVKSASAPTTSCLKAVFETDNGAGLSDIFFAAPGVSA